MNLRNLYAKSNNNNNKLLLYFKKKVKILSALKNMIYFLGFFFQAILKRNNYVLYRIYLDFSCSILYRIYVKKMKE